MPMVTKPLCSKCGTRMVVVSARIGNGPDDKRPASHRPFKKVGYMCQTCPRMIRETEQTWEFPTPLL